MASPVPTGSQLVVEVFVRDLNRSLAFYTRLGFRLVRQEPAFATLTWEDHTFFLEQATGLPPVPIFPAANVRVMVDDVDAYWRLAQEIGAKVIKPIDNRYYGLRDFTIADPDGFGVRFGTRLTEGDD